MLALSRRIGEAIRRCDVAFLMVDATVEIDLGGPRAFRLDTREFAREVLQTLPAVKEIYSSFSFKSVKPLRQIPVQE